MVQPARARLTFQTLAPGHSDKFMFSKEPGHYNFPYPLFVTSIHMFVQWSLSALTITIFPTLRPKNRPAPRDYA